MEKRKNKIPKKALAFASALIIILSLFTTFAFAQAPEITTNSNPNLSYVNILAYDDTGSNDNTIAYFHLRVTNDTKRLYSISCVLTDRYYNEYYLYDYNKYLDLSIDKIVISSYQTAGGPSHLYNGLDLVTAINSFAQLYLSSSGEQINLVSSTLLYNIVSNSIYNQFTYWENKVSNSYNEGYTNGESLGYGNGYNNGLSEGQDIGYDLGYQIGLNDGLSEGQNIGYDEGYLVGKNDGYNSGLTQGYTNAINDKELVTEAFFEIFNAPFVFVQQIVPFEIFGINLFHIFAFFLIIALAIFMFKILGKVLPL